jgi:hypothetical protein
MFHYKKQRLASINLQGVDIKFRIYQFQAKKLVKA